jgi:putative heme-binding domain-containing protein
MRDILRVSACCLAMWLTGVAVPSHSGGALSAQGFDDHRYTTTDIENGSRLYTAECALCHGSNGDEVDGVNLRTGQLRRGSSDDAIRAVVASGVGGGRMPAFDLSVEELNGLVAFIRAGFDPGGVAVRIGDAEAGRALFAGGGDCASCHRVNGVGPLTAPDLSDIGAIRTPAALQRVLLDPDGSLIPINRPIRAVTRSGETVEGRRLNEDTYSVQLIDSHGRLRSLIKADLVEYEVSQQATMRPTTLSSEQVAEVIGYLMTLQGVR